MDNLFNPSSVYDAVSFVVSGAEQPCYKTIGPIVSTNWLTWIALFTIMTGELFAGILGLLGAIQMIQKISGTADAFQKAKSNALLAGVAGMLLFKYLGSKKISFLFFKMSAPGRLQSIESLKNTPSV